MNIVFKSILVLSFLLFSFSSYAQIVVIPSSQVDTTHGWSGAINLDFYLTQNTTRIYTGSFGSTIRYAWKNQKLMSINNYKAILEFDEEDMDTENQAYQHFRYNYDFNPYITGEALVQGQFDYVLRIAFRGLIGAGPKFNFWPKSKNTLLFGAIGMYEYEEERGTEIIHRDIRLSFSLNYNIAIGENASLNLFGYYQPLAYLIKDYRISASTEFSAKITERLRWFVNASVLYDAFPVVHPDIPKITYSIRNGFGYSF